jgi:alanyl-tRNA synthetase
VSEKQILDGKIAFDLYQTYGFPLELTLEIARERGQEIDQQEFRNEFTKHQDVSRNASIGVFKGGLADHSQETTNLHTATHLIHAALRRVLGEQVTQKGSNITHERLRFDFNHAKKLTEAEIKAVEDLVNEQIDKNLPVSFEIMTLEEAKNIGALANFSERYGDLPGGKAGKVKVYSIGSFSREVCGGPHVSNLVEIGGRVKIFKEESLGAGVRRLYARIEK